MREVLRFIGVSTGGSSIVRVFPAWARELGLDAEIEGIDLPLDVGPEACREAVVRTMRDPAVRGAVVTTHKTRLFDHAGPLFAELDRYARLCREVSCIAVRDGRALGWAKDPLTARRALEEIVVDGAPEEVLCLGAGGAGLAVSVALLTASPRPSRVTLADTAPSRLELARSVHAELGTASGLACRQVSGPAEADALVAGLPTGSLVINATGMGKDVPGSPISPAARFPRGGVVWDLNYRGELPFLGFARAQAEGLRLRVVDGWRYFLHGWAEAIAEIFDVPIAPERLERLAELVAAAAPARR